MGSWGVNDGIQAGQQKTLQDLEWNAEKRDWAVVLGVVRGLIGFGQGDDSCPSPDLGYCQLVEAGGIEPLEPVLASLAAV